MKSLFERNMEQLNLFGKKIYPYEKPTFVERPAVISVIELESYEIAYDSEGESQEEIDNDTENINYIKKWGLKLDTDRKQILEAIISTSRWSDEIYQFSLSYRFAQPQNPNEKWGHYIVDLDHPWKDTIMEKTRNLMESYPGLLLSDEAMEKVLSFVEQFTDESSLYS